MIRLLLLLPVFFLASCRKASETTSTAGQPLRIGMELTYPPFEMQDTSGNPDGVGVRLAEALAADLGRPLKIVPMEFSGLLPALKSGSIDLILSSMTANEERRKSIDFSDPYAFTGLAILTGKNSTILSAEDLKKPGTRLAVKSSTTAESWAIAHAPDAKRTAFSKETACVLEVTQGRADAFIYDQLSIYRYHKANPDTTTAILKTFTEEPWAIGIAKGNEELKANVNRFLKTFRENHGFEKLSERYLAEERKFLESQGIPFILR